MQRIPRKDMLAVAVAIFLTIVFYFPVLFEGKTQAHAEGVSLGIAFTKLLTNELQSGGGVLWTDKIYGGHPIFAEGQGAFAHPLNLLVNSLFSTITGYNLYLWLSAVISSLGVYGLCRSLFISETSSLFATIAVVFSVYWIGGRSNLAVGGAISWIPWVLWAAGHWLKKMDFGSSALLGLSMCLMILAGYPHIVHGTVIYLFVYIFVLFFSKSEREIRLQQLTRHITTGCFAVFICAALAAVQWLPLIELAGLSHRSHGVEIIHIGRPPAALYLRGFIYSLPDIDITLPGQTAKQIVSFGLVGSLLVCVLASVSLFFRHKIEIKAHIAATVVLIFLGFGPATSLFNLIYESRLIPGLHNFRLMALYHFIGIVGFSVICASSIDKLREYCQQLSLGTLSRRHVLLIGVWGGLWVYFVWYLHVPTVPVSQYVLVLILALLTVLLIRFKRAHLLGIVCVLLLVVEVLMLRIGSFRFYDRDLIAEPESIVKMKQHTDLKKYKVLDNTEATTYSFWPSFSPNLELGLKRMLSSASPASNILWGVSSLSGNIALPTARRVLAQKLIDEEIKGQQQVSPGLRLIDFMSLRFITVRRSFDAGLFSEFYESPKLNVRIVENKSAYPKFQIFEDAVFVGSTTEAMTVLSKLELRQLVVESAPIAAMDIKKNGDVKFEVIEDSPENYQFSIEADHSAWFFISDSNYPGWHAYIDNKQVPLYSAQLLGKCVQLPKGKYQLSIRYEPKSFTIGLALMGVGIIVLVILFACRYLVISRGPY